MVWVYIRREDRYSKLPVFFDKYKYDYKRRNGSHIDMDAEMYNCFQHKAIAPALTLQELRELAKKVLWEYLQKVIPFSGDYNDDDGFYEEQLSQTREFERINTAPELAEWVIARLEESHE